MLDKLRELFTAPPVPGDEDAPAPATAAAALLFEVVWADHEVDEEELAETVRQLQTLFAVDAATAAALISDARKLHDRSVGHHAFTRVLNDNLDEATKIELVEAMWRVAGSHEGVNALEEHTIRRVADLLYVSHKDFIAAKLAARES